MAVKIALLALLVCCAASEAQSQGDDTSLPLSYNARTVINDITEDSCPEHAVRDEIIEMFSMDVQSDIQDTVFPSLLLSQGWTRVTYLDLTNSSHQCPAGWQTYTQPPQGLAVEIMILLLVSQYSIQPKELPIVACVVVLLATSIVYVTMAFSTYNADPTRTIHAVYVDGINITHGSNPREHVWTFASAFYESYIGTGDTTSHCTNANNSDSPNILNPPFVGDDYFCDTGTFTAPVSSNDVFTNNPLWDGKGCGPTSTCFVLNNPPWFCKTLPVSQPVTNDIELRTCGSHSSSIRDVPIELIELLVL